MKKLQFATTEGLEIANHLEAIGFVENTPAVFDMEADEEEYNVIVDKENRTYWNVDNKALEYSRDLRGDGDFKIEEVSLEEVNNWK